jgi:hypothetical protein
VDEIAHQLRSEIQSLEEHIERARNRLLAASWADELIGPFEEIENTLKTEDLSSVVVAFHHARNSFKVNGHLADRIDAILARHVDLISELGLTTTDVESAEYEGGVLPPDADPGDTSSTDEAGSLFFDEDEELPEEGGAVASDAPHLPAFDEAAVEFGFDGNPDTGLPDYSSPDSGNPDFEMPGTVEFPRGELPAAELSTAEFSGGDSALTDTADAVEIDFGKDAPVSGVRIDFGKDEASTDRVVDFGADDPSSAPAGRMDAGSDDLFASSAPAPPSAPGNGSRPASGPASSSEDNRRESLIERPSESAPSLYSIFSHPISVDDVAAGLGLVVPAQDRTLLEQKLRTRLSDPVVAALRAQKSAEKQFILLPRLARGAQPAGGTLPLTVKNMAKRYIGLFGDIRDLMRYRNDSRLPKSLSRDGHW